ncbi:hypothetical protein MKEN_01161900 [Mycena kentingensis (nom. inval.)]|nr:hypothetical protein MKEN_01161900 [Mycena kentingensis (nom. inval.)]
MSGAPNAGSTALRAEVHKLQLHWRFKKAFLKRIFGGRDACPPGSNAAWKYGHIPTEIWEHIFSHCAIAELAALSATAHYFYLICGPMRFSAICIATPLGTESKERGDWRALKRSLERKDNLLLWLAKGPHNYSTALKKLEVINTSLSLNAGLWTPRRFKQYGFMWASFAATLPDRIASLRGITTLVLRAFVVDERLAPALESLELLEHFTLSTPKIATSLVKRLPLKYFHLCEPSSFACWQLQIDRGPVYASEGVTVNILAPSTLYCLNVSRPLIGIVLRPFIHLQQPLHNLSILALTLKVEDWPLLRSAFALFPRVAKVALIWDVDFDAPPPNSHTDNLEPVPAAHAPALRDLAASPEFVPLLAPTRPITNLQISACYGDAQSWPTIRAALSCAAGAPLTTLALWGSNIPPIETPRFLNTLASLFPALESLEFALQELDDNFAVGAAIGGRADAVEAGENDMYVLRKKLRARGTSMLEERTRTEPGFRYDLKSGMEYPPPHNGLGEENCALKICLNAIAEQRPSLPAHLQSIYFDQALWSTAEEHAALLMLERLHNPFRTIQFGGVDRWSKWVLEPQADSNEEVWKNHAQYEGVSRDIKRLFKIVPFTCRDV